MTQFIASSIQVPFRALVLLLFWLAANAQSQDVPPPTEERQRKSPQSQRFPPIPQFPTLSRNPRLLLKLLRLNRRPRKLSRRCPPVD